VKSTSITTRANLMTFSTNSYANGQWTKGVSVKIKSYVVVVIPDEKDYSRGDGDATVPYDLNIKDSLYVGGVPETVSVVIDGMNIRKTPFKGCIKSLKIHDHKTEVELSIIAAMRSSRLVTYETNSPEVSIGVKSCYDNVLSGFYFPGDAAYISLPDTDLAPPFTIKMSIRPLSTSGLLVVSYIDEQNFFIIDINDSITRVILANSQATKYLEVSDPRGYYQFCDNSIHDLTVTYDQTSVSFQVDDEEETEVSLPSTFTYKMIGKYPLYFGGVKDENWIHPLGETWTQFKGCLSSMNYGGQNIPLQSSTDTSGVLYGCGKD